MLKPNKDPKDWDVCMSCIQDSWYAVLIATLSDHQDEHMQTSFILNPEDRFV